MVLIRGERAISRNCSEVTLATNARAEWIQCGASPNSSRRDKPRGAGGLKNGSSLKDGHRLSLGAVLNRPFANGSELSVCSIRGRMRLKADRGDSVAAGPRTHSRKFHSLPRLFLWSEPPK